jgi:hypothetical protein
MTQRRSFIHSSEAKLTHGVSDGQETTTGRIRPT